MKAAVSITVLFSRLKGKTLFLSDIENREYFYIIIEYLHFKAGIGNEARYLGEYFIDVPFIVT
jgi:hypothetical protein